MEGRDEGGGLEANYAITGDRDFDPFTDRLPILKPE